MSRDDLKRDWGLEVILRCGCGDIPSHHMDGRVPRCPKCRQNVEVLYGENWEKIREKYPRTL